ncbi:hypothetical protein [Shimia sp. SDUM112013]|uniref:hypothetical protein n=1 Tax=Shimia sp. SDUM112013 TaxID=3136160 RepID=UPI0032EC7A05
MAFPKQVRSQIRNTKVLLAVSALAGLCCLLAGVASIGWSPTATSRVGAVMVALGVLLFSMQNSLQGWWFDVARDSGKLLNKNQLLWKEKRDQAYSFSSFSIPEARGSDATVEALGNTAMKQLRRLSVAMRSVELFFLFVGTLIWGFGDLVNCWFKSDGWTTC